VGRYLLAWFPMILVAVANGALREAWLAPRLGEHAARQVSTLLLIALFAGCRLWALVPLWVAVAPYFFFRLWR
jgi:hypothetical protein